MTEILESCMFILIDYEKKGNHRIISKNRPVDEITTGQGIHENSVSI